MEPSPQTAQQDSFEEARKAIEERRVILGPCLAALGFTEQGGCPPDLPQHLQFEGQAIPLESWQRSVLLGHSSRNTETLLAHLAEGIAFQAKSSSTLHRLEIDPPQSNDFRKLGGVIEQTAVGLALLEELQRDIDRLVGKGEMSDAKKLTTFRGRIVQAVSCLKKNLGPPAQEQAHARSTEMLTPRMADPPKRKRVLEQVCLDLPAQSLIETSPEPEPEKEPGETQLTPEERFELGLRERELERIGEDHAAEVHASHTPDPARRIRLLLYLLVLCAAAYAAFLLARPASVPMPDRLGVEAFEHLGGVLQVRPRPPSLFVKLDPERWAEMSPEARLELVENIGRIAGTEGYFGVLVRTVDGQTVGQWLKKTGASLTLDTPSS